MPGASKASRFSGGALVAALYAMTLAGCAIDLAGHEPTTRDAIAPEPMHQSDPHEARTPALKSRAKVTKDVVTTSLTESYFVNQLLLGIKDLPRLTSAED